MSFADEIRAKQQKLKNRPLDQKTRTDAMTAIENAISELTDDPYNCGLRAITINYTATNDGNGTCKYWIGNASAPDDILFEMPVTHFECVLDALVAEDKFSVSCSFGPKTGHARVTW